jgi:hypothetical protein
MSTLSRQLAVLRKTSGADGRNSRSSFLFTHEDAQRVDTETIYNIALTGLMQLTKMDSRFVQFESKLFGPSTRTLRRDHETKESNARIDNDITAYLRLLSAYLLQRPAQQTLEFLVRAYQVQRFNVDAVVECFIPYHQTKPFIRMVKILQIHGTKWQFLDAVRQTGMLVQCARPNAKLTVRCILRCAFAEEDLGETMSCGCKCLAVPFGFHSRNWDT